MTPQPGPMPPMELARHMTALAADLHGYHPADILALAGFLATNAARCWPPECRLAVAEEWCATLKARLRESLD